MDDVMQAHLEHVVDGLVNQTGGAIPRHQLRDVVYDCYERLARDAVVTTFLPVLTNRYAMMQVRAMGIVNNELRKTRPEILVLDDHNSARSQTVSALIRFYGPGRFRVESAGVHPAPTVNPVVQELLDEAGVRLTDFPKPVTPQMITAADHLIVIGEVPLGESNPVGKSEIRWDVPDLSHEDRTRVAEDLAGLDDKVGDFLRTIDPGHRLPPPALRGVIDRP